MAKWLDEAMEADDSEDETVAARGTVDAVSTTRNTRTVFPIDESEKEGRRGSSMGEKEDDGSNEEDGPIASKSPTQERVDRSESSRRVAIQRKYGGRITTRQFDRMARRRSLALANSVKRS